MKQILTYADLLLFEDLLRDYLANLRHRAEKFGHHVESVIEAAEASRERVAEALERFPDEDL